MIVVKVEVWPQGEAERATPLGVIVIANDGPALLHPDAGDGAAGRDLYSYRVQLHKNNMRGKERRIEHYRRRGWLTLVRRALETLDA